MRTLMTASLAILAFSAAMDADAICGRSHRHSSARPTAQLPPDAKPGECYARVAHPAEYREVVDSVVRKEASENIRIIPAVYESRTEQVLVKPATTRIVEVPAEYEMVERQVEVAPASQEWRRGACNPKSIVDNATGECWCLVDVPARYKTVKERVVAVPATTRSIDVPAEYQTVTKRVLVEPEREERIPVPAVVENVTRRELVSPESVEWVLIPCEPSADKGAVHHSNDKYSMPRLGNRVH